MGFAGRQKQLQWVTGVPGNSESCVFCEKQEKHWSQFLGRKERSWIHRYLVYTYSRYRRGFTLEENLLQFLHRGSEKTHAGDATIASLVAVHVCCA